MKRNILFLTLSVTASLILSSCGINGSSGAENNAGTQVNVISSGFSHTHRLANEPNTVSEPISGYCGNTFTTVFYKDKKYTFCFEDSIILTDMLINMEYDKDKVCECETEYEVDTEFGDGYGFNLTQGFARSNKGQAELTEEQLKRVKKVMNKLGSKYKPA